MARSLWVAKLKVSKATAEKLSAKHGLDYQEVRNAIVGVADLTYVWHHHRKRGRRALVMIWVGNRRCVAVLYQVKDGTGDVYALGSAYPR